MAQAHPFVDHVRIYFSSGKGGDGVVAWRREKYVPKGGPDGGDGGDGGSIIIKGNGQLWTLLDLKYRKFIKAEKGQQGSGSKKKGKSGKDEVLEVPLGTVIRDADTDEVLGEITEDKQEIRILEGGTGGRGNWHFRSATNQAPDFAEQGRPGSELTAILELKVLADVGLVGFPNAGKSTLLAAVTAAKPKIADYPFTTLIPNLGIVKVDDYQSFVMADIPGIIEGAHEGKGLGHQFLRHIERNAILLLLIPADTPDYEETFNILLNELKEYNPQLLEKELVAGISKIDLKESTECYNPDFDPGENIPVVEFSAATGEGIDRLLRLLFEKVQQVKNSEETD